MNDKGAYKKKGLTSFHSLPRVLGKVMIRGFFIILCFLILIQFINSTQATERVTYGVTIGIMDQPFFPNQGKWNGLMNISIENTGSASEFFSIECTQSPPGWEIIILENTVEVGTDSPFNVKVVGIVVSCPQMEEEGDYPVHIKTTCMAQQSCSDSIVVDVQVLLAPRVEVEGPLNADPMDTEPANGVPDYREGEPGESLTYEFSIRNTGNGEEAFFISVESPNNWWIELQGASSTLPLAINQTISKSVRIRIPDNANNGESDVLKFTATSQSDTDVHDIINLETVVRQIHIVGLETTVPSTYSYPDFEVELPFNITNEGNGADRTVEMVLSSVPIGWSAEINMPDYSTHGIPIYGKAPCELSVMVPLEALNKTYSITIDAYSGGKQMSDSHLTFHITVFQEYSFQLQQGKSSLNGAPGDKLLFNFSLMNSGNGVDTFDIALKVGDEDEHGSWFSTNINETTLETGCAQEILIDCLIPELTRSTDYTITIQISSQGASTMQLIVKDSITFTVRVNKEYKLGIAHTKPGEDISINSDGLSVESRTKLVYFNVTNLGNCQDIVVFSVHYPEEDGWPCPDFMISRAMLQYNEYKNDLGLIIVAPRGTPVGTYHFTLFVNSTKDPGEVPASGSIDLVVKIVRYDVQINSTILFDSEYICQGETVVKTGMDDITMTVELNNIGKLYIEQINVSLYINDVSGTHLHRLTAYKLEIGESDTLTFNFQPMDTKKYNLFFVVDPDNTISEKDENNNIFNFTCNIQKIVEEVIPESQTLDLFGREWTVGEFTLLVIAIILFMVMVGVILIRTSSMRTHKKVKETGLVASGKYEFKEREASGLDLFDVEDLLAEEEGLMDAKPKKGNKTKKGSYYIIKDIDKGNENAGSKSGFTIGDGTFMGATSDQFTRMKTGTGISYEEVGMVREESFPDYEMNSGDVQEESNFEHQGKESDYIEHSDGLEKLFVLGGDEGTEKMDTAGTVAWNEASTSYHGSTSTADGTHETTDTSGIEMQKTGNRVTTLTTKPTGRVKTITTKPATGSGVPKGMTMKPITGNKTLTTRPAGKIISTSATKKTTNTITCTMKPVMEPTMKPVMRPTMKPVMRPTMRPVGKKDKKNVHT